mmetsp:Transcript_4952/g.7335  ORF Transcript_4952/g.7335 Transcript_4952/m.7335 type:complete len:292 (+) Transcript_4952:70-945(+)
MSEKKARKVKFDEPPCPVGPEKAEKSNFTIELSPSSPPPPTRSKKSKSASPEKTKHHKHHKKRPKFEEKYTMGEDVIGEGATAIVKVCTDNKGEEYAVKIMERKQVHMDESKFNLEISVLSKLRHPNIIRLYDVFKTKDKIMVVTELACGGELFDRLLDEKSFAEKDAAKITRKLFDAIRHMHEQGICHRDLKPENIMFKSPAKQSQLKIVDFGFASSLLDKKKKVQNHVTAWNDGLCSPRSFHGETLYGEVRHLESWCHRIYSSLWISTFRRYERRNKGGCPEYTFLGLC